MNTNNSKKKKINKQKINKQKINKQKINKQKINKQKINNCICVYFFNNIILTFVLLIRQYDMINELEQRFQLEHI